ncbi:MAG: hypothetical protein JWQ49_1030 [Edaphobacter sp.]|nr:hypothetical protein [Edaphobacter sp.]
MKSPPIIVLFGDPPPLRRGPSGILVSLSVHGLVCVLLYLGFHQARTADSTSIAPRFAVRIMELRKEEPKLHAPVQRAVSRPDELPDTHPTAPGGSRATAAAARIPLNFISQKEAIQTLIQPDAPTNPTIPQIPLPQVFVWTSRDITVKNIVQPAKQTTAAIDVRPSLDPPNQETHVADIKISSTAYDTKAPLPAPSKTSPINVPATQQAQQMPQTASKDTGKATPAGVMSASNIQLQEGTATLPLINEVAPAPYAGSLTAGQPKSLSQTGQGKAEAKENGAGAGQTAGNQAGNQAGNAAGGGGSGGQGGANGQGGAGAEASVTGGASQPTVVHITLPKDGKFGVVVVGSSLAEDYPETVHLWSGRLAYTVYLRVGVGKNWILQYSLPRAQEVASTGSASRPDAPWPYDMTRPSIDPDANTDAIMVHGFVNTAGRFEQLAVVFPTALAEAKFLLHALQQWQFRPSMQSGQATAVEVLLIIPAETE